MNVLHVELRKNIELYIRIPMDLYNRFKDTRTH